jgi:hypothetical protein
MEARQEFGFVYPPRPEKAIPIEMLSFFQMKGWISQIKKNGTCTVLIVSPEGVLDIWTREGERHKLWKPDFNSPCLRKFKDLPKGWFIFVGELLHSKGTGQKDTLYLFDLLVADSKSLVGKTFIQRIEMLFKLWPILKDERDDYCEVDERLWLSKPIINKSFLEIFQNLPPTDEGIVLKDPSAPLEICGKQSNNQSWQVKCRKPTKNFAY